MTDEDWLRRGLADAVPEPPAAPDRAGAARRTARRRRRTTLAVAGGAVAVVAVAATVVGAATLGGGDDRPDRVAAPAPVDALSAPACPGQPVDARAASGPDRVPDGATSVRLCQGDGVPADVPLDALVTQVDDVAAAVNGLEPLPRDAVCTADLGPGYQLQFAYPDGSTVVASGGLYGCREVVVNGVVRSGADAPWQRFVDLLRAQREGLDPPPPVAASTIGCPTAPTGAGAPSLGRPQDLVVAVYCAEDVPGSGDWRRAAIPAADLATLVTDIDAHTEEDAGYVDCDVAPPLPRIIGATAWGDRVEVQASCTNGWFTVDHATNSVWSPSDEARAVLDRLSGEAR
ncbi:hypothetical protein L615_000100000180 [Nocardioides sp. J9]|uniref:hypothetical protein n=1 Tax=unclassified Nocardioides TaxID=2615069 RepID=UPI0004BBBD21|nr:MULTISPECIES: hypothetical protein [unclassified Nocardioides]TWH04863.1 hypothetical protein L615_000100000180 [Nocardioides sp. J9]